MNKLIVSGVVVMFVMALVLSFLVHGVLLDGDYTQLQSWMRPQADAQSLVAYIIIAQALFGKEQKNGTNGHLKKGSPSGYGGVGERLNEADLDVSRSRRGTLTGPPDVIGDRLPIGRDVPVLGNRAGEPEFHGVKDRALADPVASVDYSKAIGEMCK